MKVLPSFAKSQQHTKLEGRFFILPICTGTSAIDIHFLPYESPRTLISLTPLCKDSINQMAFEKWPQEASTMIASPIWDIAVGDSMGIPRFVEWMLEVEPSSYNWSDAINHKLQKYNAFNSLEHFGGAQGAEMLLALALTEHPVHRTHNLGACGHVGQVERNGTIYLVPVKHRRSEFLVSIPFPVCKLLCNLLSKGKVYLFETFFVSDQGHSRTIGPHTIIPHHLMFSPTPERKWLWQDFAQLYPYFQSLVIRSLKLIQEAMLEDVKAKHQFQQDFLKNPDEPRFLRHKEKQPTDTARQIVMNVMQKELAKAQLCYDQHHCIADLFRGALGKKKKKGIHATYRRLTVACPRRMQ